MLSAKNEHIDVDGAHFDYIVFGTGNKNLIILPGVGDGFKTAKGMAVPFAALYRKFAEKYKVYVFSRRNPLPEGFAIMDMAEDIARVMDHIGLQKADVMGVSQGGMIAQQFAICFPEKVEKLVLVVTAPGGNALMEEVLTNWLEWSKQGEYKRIMLDTAKRSYTGKFVDKSLKAYGFLSDVSKPKDFTRFQILCKACLEFDAREDLKRIHCPTYIIGGGQDQVLGVDASKELAEKIAGSELYIYEDLSHGLYEQAKDFNDRVLAWLEKDHQIEKLLHKMCCPKCHSKFKLVPYKVEGTDVVEGTLQCEHSHRFGIHAGVIDFGSEEQEGLNTWSEYLKSTDYDEMEKQIEDAKSQKEKEQQAFFLKTITDCVLRQKPETVIDIASGRGMLLEKLIANLPDSAVLVATDLSFEIMAKDRIKFKKLYPEKSIVYMACDATQMPFADHTVDVTVSFFGVANMFQLVEQGICEAARVTGPNGVFFNGYLNVKEDSEGFQIAKEMCIKQNMQGVERVFLEQDVKNLHQKYFRTVEVQTVIEDIFEKKENVIDLFPYPGEWFAYRIYEGRGVFWNKR